MNDTINRKVQVVVADPSALGLLGLAIVTGVASSQKLHITEGLSFIIPWAIFLGAMAQLIAAVYDFKHNNVFGASIFGAFGLFWLAVVFSWLIQMGVLGAVLKDAVDIRQLGVAILIYFVFAVAGTIASTETNKVIFIDMVFICFLLLGLAVDCLGQGVKWAATLAAYSEVFIAIISTYGACAAFLNSFYGRQFLPMGGPLGLFKKG